MSLGAWLMLAFAVIVLFGGLGICIRIAIVTDRRKAEEGRTFDDDGAE